MGFIVYLIIALYTGGLKTFTSEARLRDPRENAWNSNYDEGDFVHAYRVSELRSEDWSHCHNGVSHQSGIEVTTVDICSPRAVVHHAVLNH